MNKFQKLLTIFLSLSIFLLQNPAVIHADELTLTPPPIPTAPPALTPPPNNITPPPVPTPPPIPTFSALPTPSPIPSETPVPTSTPVSTPTLSSTSTPGPQISDPIETSTESGTINLESSQSNLGNVENDVTATTNTGNNSTTGNTGGNSSITTGDANTSGTIVTAINTNINGLTVHEFDINDNQTGDIVLNFNDSNCTTNCNGLNNATLGNNLTLASNTGQNTASRNTDGDSIIQTGNANIEANALTFANNNLDGDVVYGVVNIYGSLEGNIILPESEISNCNCATIDPSQSSLAENKGNITNNLNYLATTGENVTNYNTNGNSSITTGDANVDAQALNIANTNVNGGTWWLVLVNNAGNWTGRIVGGNGTNIASSEGGMVTINSNTNTNETNTANITNNINLTANTGGNRASYNTGGNSSITTGDANIIVNLVNFVNNNITGGGKLVVTVVNVFGSWLGDFVTPGQVTATSTPAASPMIQTISNESLNNPIINYSTPAPTSNPQGLFLSSNLPTRTTIASIKTESPGQVLATQTSKDIPVKKVAKINLAWLIIPVSFLGIYKLTIFFKRKV